MHSKNHHWRTLQTTHSDHHHQRATVRGQECDRNIYIINRLRTGLAVERPLWRSYWARPLVGEGWLDLATCAKVAAVVMAGCALARAGSYSQSSGQCTWRRAARELYRLLVRQPAKKNCSAENQAQPPFYSGRCFGERSSAVNQAKFQGEKPNAHYRPFEVAFLHPPNCCHPRPT